MKTATYFGFALCIACAFSACDSDKPKPPPEWKVTSEVPIALENALLYTASTGEDVAQRTLLVDLAGNGARVVTGELPEGAPHLFARPGHAGEALVLTSGAPARLEEDGEAHDAVPSHLLVFDRNGEAKRFTLSGSYASLSVSEDGRFAIAHQPSGPWSSADSIAVVDLEAANEGEAVPATNVRALDGQGPSAVAFSPKGSQRRLAVLVMSDAINVLDLERPERKDKVLPLKLPNGTGSLRAKKVLFSDNDCFVQADNGINIFAVSFEEEADSFRATLSTFATGSVVSDMALLEPEPSGARRLLALGTGTLRLIDTKSGKGESSSSGMAFSSFALFRGTSPFDDVARPQALLYAQSGTKVGFVDLQEDLAASERNVEILSLSGSITSLTLIESAGLALVLQNDQRVSLIDLAERTVSSLSAGQALKDLMLDRRDGVARAWLLTTGGTLGSIDLDKRAASEVLLTHPATWVLPLFGETPRIVVGHQADRGALTLLDAAAPSRASAREVLDFL